MSKKYFFFKICILLTFLFSFQHISLCKVSKTDRNSLNLIFQNTDLLKADETILKLKLFVDKHPQLTLSSVNQLAALYVYSGKGKEGIEYFSKLPTNKLFQKARGLYQLQILGLQLPKTIHNALLNEIASNQKSWKKLDMKNQYLLEILIENKKNILPKVKELPIDKETKLYREVSEKIKSLKLKGIHELLIQYPKNSDYLFILCDLFPNTSGKIDLQHSEMQFLAKYCKKENNLESLLLLQSQIIEIEVSYLNETILDNSYFEQVIKNSKKYLFIDTAVSLTSSLAIHNILQYNYEKALEYSIQSSKMAEKYNLQVMAGISYGYMGICYANLSQFDKAIESYETACKNCEKTSQDWYRIWREKLSYCYAIIGDTETAEKIELIILEEEIKNNQPIQIMYANRNLAELYIKTGELKKAKKHLSKVQLKSFPGLIKKNNAIYGRLAYASGNYKKAVKYYNKCLSNKAPIDVPTTIYAISELASSYQALQKNNEAEQAYKKATNYLELLANTRFKNLNNRKLFFRQYHNLYLNYISFLVNISNSPDKAWLLIKRMKTGPFQYFTKILTKHLQSILSFPEPKLPNYSFKNSGKNSSLKKLMVKVNAVATNEKLTIIAGPGGVFKTDGLFYTKIHKNTKIIQLAIDRQHWAGITEKSIILDGKVISLPKSPDRILTTVNFFKDSLLLGSSTGIYIYKNNNWKLVLKKPIIQTVISKDEIKVAVSQEGIISINLLNNKKNKILYPNTNILKSIISFSKISENQILVFTTNSITFLNKHRITSNISFKYGIIKKATPLGTGRWIITTVLNNFFIFENGQIYSINTDNYQLLTGCSTKNTSFITTNQTILVETKNQLHKTSLVNKTGYDFPNCMGKVGNKQIALGFRGKGIGLFQINNSAYLGFFKSQIEQFVISKSNLAILTNSGHVKIFSGTLPDKLNLEKTFYPSSPIQTMLLKKDNNLLASFIGGGIALWQKNKAPHFFGIKQGLPSGDSIFVMKNFNGNLKLGTNETIMDFNLQKITTVIPIGGKVTCFSKYNENLIAGTTLGTFSIEKSTVLPIFNKYVTGQVYSLDSNKHILVAATENGVYLKKQTGIFHIPTPEKCHFVALSNSQLAMISNKFIYYLKRKELPTVVQIGQTNFVVNINNKFFFCEKKPHSLTFLTTNDGKIIPVSLIASENFKVNTTELSFYNISIIPLFGGKLPYFATPSLTEHGKKTSISKLKPGNHKLTIAGTQIFNNKNISFNLKVTRKISAGWLLSGILGLITIILLAMRYFKWKKGKYIGHYKLLKKLGEGGMGTVYQAKNIRTNDTVALKILNRQVDEVMIERFKREWQILDKISHQNIVKVYDRGEHMEQFFIAMEFVHGNTMDELLKKHGHLPEHIVISTAIAVASALESIHKEFIVHRDLKPSNIMCARSTDKITGKIKPGEIKLMDFGVSKELLKEGLTTVGSLVGTLRYVAPESISSLDVDARSDIYALGITMYQLLTGIPPFDDENQISIYYKILNTTPPKFPQSLKISNQLQKIVFRCLEKEPEKRFQDANELKTHLEKILI